MKQKTHTEEVEQINIKELSSKDTPTFWSGRTEHND